MIPFLDLGAATRELRGDIDAAVDRVIGSGWYIGGPEVEAFETAWASYCGPLPCVRVAHGLDAPNLALQGPGGGPGRGAVGAEAGDEVVVARRVRGNPSANFSDTARVSACLAATPYPTDIAFAPSATAGGLTS